MATANDPRVLPGTGTHWRRGLAAHFEKMRDIPAFDAGARYRDFNTERQRKV